MDEIEILLGNFDMAENNNATVASSVLHDLNR